MMWFEKAKEGVKEIVKQHPVSICAFLIGCILLGLISDFLIPDAAEELLDFCSRFCMCMTPAFVLCEANFAYKKKIGKISSLLEIGKSVVYLVVVIVAAVVSGIFSYINVYLNYKYKSDFTEYFPRVFYVYLAICLLSAIFFMYKKTGDSFEGYSVRAFLGFLKAGLIHGIITLGTFCILWVFDTLFVNLGIETTILWIVTGIVGFPAYLMAFSAPGDKLSRFSKVVMGFVFPGILAIAFVIVYAYIIKILVTWTFPSNQVFAIMTGMFGSGILFWTMAQGCTEGRANSLLKTMPLLFCPFIIIQIMCLAMRISDYGLTASRYLGILLIIFEILYEAYYIVRMMQGQGLGGILMPTLLVFVIVYYLIPGINVYASVTRSQMAVVRGYVDLKLGGHEGTSTSLSRARSGYREIRDNGGLEGKLSLQRLYAESSQDKVEDILDINASYASDVRTYYVNVYDTKREIDVAGYSHLKMVDTRIYDGKVDIADAPVRNDVKEGEDFDRADISAVIFKLKELEQSGTDEDEMNDILKEPVKTDNGLLLIDYITFEFTDEDPAEKIDDFELRGYYLCN